MTLGFASCGDKWEPDLGTDGTSKGSVSLKTMGVEVTNPDGTDARATYNLDNFTVAIHRKADDVLVGTEYLFKNLPDIVTLPVGEYYVEVTSGANAKAAFDAPWFAGEKDFSIIDGEITEIGTVVCKLGNIKVTITFTDELKAVAGSESKVTVIANDEGSLDFGLNETRSGYFEALEGSSTLVASFTGTINGVVENNIRKIYRDVKAGDHYIIKFGLAKNPDMDEEFGNVDLDGILLDVTHEVENVDNNINMDEEVLDGSDRTGKEDTKEEPIVPDDPVDPGINDTIEFTTTPGTLNLTGVNELSEFGPGAKEAKVNMASEYPIANLLVVIDSPALPAEDLEGMGLAKEMDIANPGDCAQGLTDLGLLNPDVEVKGAKTAEFDITSFMPMLGAIAQPGQLHKFVLTLKDNAGHSKSITLTFKS